MNGNIRHSSRFRRWLGSVAVLCLVVVVACIVKGCSNHPGLPFGGLGGAVGFGGVASGDSSDGMVGDSDGAGGYGNGAGGRNVDANSGGATGVGGTVSVGGGGVGGGPGNLGGAPSTGGTLGTSTASCSGPYSTENGSINALPAVNSEAGCAAGCSATSPSLAVCTDRGCMVTVATCQSAPSGIAVDASNVYWTSSGNGVLMKAPRAGGASVVLAKETSMSNVLVVDAVNIYWVGSSRIVKIPLDGGTSSTLVGTGAGGIAVDASFLYWTYWTNSSDGTVMKVPLGGGTPVTVATGQSRPGAIALDATNIYWANYNAVMNMPIASGKASKLADVDPNGGPFLLAIDNANLFYAAESTGTVVRVPLDRNSAMTLAQGQQTISGIAVIGTNVYWPSSNGVMTVPVDGGSPTLFASPISPKGGTQSPRGLAAYGTQVYWIDQPSPIL